MSNSTETKLRFETMIEAESKAAELTESTGIEHIAYKSSYLFSPFKVAALPQIGDNVSTSFNGDSYYCGKIVKIGKNHCRITTDTGHVFNRSKKKPMNWKDRSGFAMVSGIIEKRNPHL